MEKKIKKPTKLRKKKTNLPRFSCSLTLVCVHLFSPWWWILFLSLHKAGVQRASGTLCWAWWSMFPNHPDMAASATLKRESRFWFLVFLFCFVFWIDWDLKPEINIHTLHRTEHRIAIYFKVRVISPHPQQWGRVGDQRVSVCLCAWLCNTP